MSVLKDKLNVVYENNPKMKESFSFDDIHEKLHAFLKPEGIVKQSRFISPYEFGKTTGLTNGEAIALFVLLSSVEEDSVLQICYQYTCVNGNDNFLYEDELSDFECDEDCYCGEAFDLKECIVDGSIDVPIFFELHPDFKEQFEKEIAV